MPSIRLKKERFNEVQIDSLACGILSVIIEFTSV
jgi:hypothetical protein